MPTSPPRTLRVLRLEGSPAARGAAHGEAYRDEIRRYTEERVALACSGEWAGRKATRADVLALAERMLPAHEAYDADLYEELVAMARAAGITPAEAVIVGGFTDFVDAVRAEGASAPHEDDCTAAIVPDARAGGRGYFAQTWDMHASATEHVVLLDLRPAGGPAALVFSTVGCLAQIGMNEAGLAVGINNLTGRDGRVGVTWPTVVRRALRETTADAALAVLLAAPLAGAHNYQLFDAAGVGYNVEAMSTWQGVTPLRDEPLLHTNHALAPEAVARQAPRPADLMAQSIARLQVAQAWLDVPQVDDALLRALLAEPTAVCRRDEPPHHLETSGATICRPRTRELWAVWGRPDAGTWERFVVGAWRGEGA